MSSDRNKSHNTKVYAIGIAAFTAITGMVYWKWKQRQHKSFTELSTNIKTNAYLHCYSWMRYYAPLLINNIAIISVLALYTKTKYSRKLSSIPEQSKRFSFIVPSPPSYRHQPEKSTYSTFFVNFPYDSWQFYFNDILLIASSLNVLFCICIDQIFNSDPFHPLMLFEKHIEYKFIYEYKKSVNKIINEFVDNNLNNKWLFDVIWEYITHDTKKSHMIIDVKFTNTKLKHQSYICRKYKSLLASQFKMYQQDMKFAYSMNGKKRKEIKPNFEYFWKIKTFGFDINVFARDYLDTFILRDFQQITQFMLWFFVNCIPIYLVKKYSFTMYKNLSWKYGAIVMGRETAFYAVLIRIASIKWFCGGFFILPHFVYTKFFLQNQSNQLRKRRNRKRKQKVKKCNPVATKPNEPEIDWFWATDKLN
eukprot:242893_1